MLYDHFQNSVPSFSEALVNYLPWLVSLFLGIFRIRGLM